MTFTASFAKASERLSALIRCDVAFLSPQSRARELHVALTTNLPVVANTTKYLMIPVLYNQIVQGISLVYKTVPVMAAGTTTIQVDYVAVDGSTTTNIVAATSLLLQATGVPLALTLAATNPASCAAGGEFLFTVATSNNTVGTADVGGGLTLLSYPVEQATVTESQT